MDDSIVSFARLNNCTSKHDLSPRKNHLISFFTSLEVTLTDKKRKYFDKIQALLTAWEQIVNFVSETSAESPQPAFDFLFVNTLRFVLSADWPRTSSATQTHLRYTLYRFQSVLVRSETYPSILRQCRTLEAIVQSPWGHAVLCKILNNSQEIDSNEYVDYFNVENGKVIVVRLEMLLQSKCEDIAVHLSKACIHTYNSYNEDLQGFDTLDFTQDEIDYITDIYFSSLLKTKKKPELIAEIKNYQLDDGYRLLQRYRKDGVGGKYNENCKNARVWKCNKKLIDLLSNTLLANAVLNESLLESQSQLEDLILEWAAVQTTNDVLPPLALEMIRKFVVIAPSSKCIYPFCSFLIRNGSCKNHDINQVARCLIRAINQNMNEIEQYRVNQQRDKLKETYNQLSNGFLLISELFAENKNIYKECLLTSFSLTPSRECLQTMEEFIVNLTNIVETSECETQPETPDQVEPNAAEAPVKNHDTSELNEIFESMGVPENEVSQTQTDSTIIKPLDFKTNSDSGSAPAYLSEIENLKLEDSLRVDLNCILRYQRYHTLNWDVEWDELKKNCEQYLEDFEKKGFDDVELKYLNLDYNQFKDKPVVYDDNGIEKGYEQFAYSPVESEEEYTSKRSGLSSYDSEDDIIVGSKKRRKILSSDSEEPKAKKKRGRKPKLRNPDDPKPHRRSSFKKKKDHSVDSDEHEILESINNLESNPNSLKELRQFRISGLNRLNQDGADGKAFIDDNHNESVDTSAENLELNSALEDSFKELENFDIPPLASHFNVYDVILDNTLVPSDSEIRLPKCEDLVNNENICNNKPYEFPPAKPKKPKSTLKRERDPEAKKRPPKVPGESKPRPKPRPKIAKKSFANGSTFANTSLLSNDQLFRKKYGTKQKIEDVLCESVAVAAVANEYTNSNGVSLHMKDCVVQLPKLNDTFNELNTPKKVFPMKPSDQNNANFPPPCMADAFVQATIKDNNNDALIEHNGNFVRSQARPTDGYVGAPNTISTPAKNVAQERVCDNLDDIKILETLLKQIVGANPSNYPSSDVANTNDAVTYENAPMESKSTVQPEDGNFDGDLSVLFDILDDHPLKTSPSKPADFSFAASINIPKILPTVSKLVSAPASVMNNTKPVISTATSNLYNASFTKTTASKRNDPKVVHQILGQYREVIDKYPHLQNVPAPRKRATSTNPSSKRQRSRTKNNAEAVLSVDEALKNESYLASATQSNDYSQQNAYTSFADNSQSKLPSSYAAPIATSSQITKSSPTQTQPLETAAFQRTTGTQTNKAARPRPVTYRSKTNSKTTNRMTYGIVNAANINNGVQNYVTPPKSNDTGTGTLKALLMQGGSVSSNLKTFDSTPYGHVVSSPTDTKVHLQMPVASNDVKNNFVTAPKTYGQSSNHGQFPTSNVPFSAPPQSYTTAGNEYRVARNTIASTAPSVSTNQLNQLNGVEYSSQKTYNTFSMPGTSVNSMVNGENGITSISYGDNVPNSELFTDVQVRIPRISIKMDPNLYNKANFYVDEQSKFTTDANVNVGNIPSSEYTVKNLPKNNATVVSTAAPTSSQAFSQTFSANNFNRMKPNPITDNQYQPAVVLPDIASAENELKIPVLYATVSNTNVGEISNSDGVCISIPESAYSEGYFESYLNNFIHST